MSMKLTKGENHEFLHEAADCVPLGRKLNDPIEVANSLLFLASEDASFMNGEIMQVDGGQGLTTDNYDDYTAMLKNDFDLQ